MKQGLFINAKRANCSIYESGIMIRNAIRNSDKFSLDYMEVLRDTESSPYYKDNIPDIYDFYVINWHHWTTPIPKDVIDSLPGKKISIILEVSSDNCFPYAHPDWFDAYMVIDSTKSRHGRVYPFPRPLESVGGLKPLLDDNKIIIGSFGLLTGGKRFEEIIKVANRLREDCIVRINLPPVTYMGDIGVSTRLKNYADFLRGLIKSNVDLRITHEYMNKPKLIRWCSEHTINSFPYYRNQPGLAAVTDQAISAGRAIAITDCDTFRHLHQYISYYPKQSYLELIESTISGVRQMQIDWHKDKFKEMFEELLVEEGVL